ncbi:hypothetical protein, partial [Vibrio sp. 10N.222.52.B7]|uniref:hypothetical protein n=1 Tax=Vibrio sp. 10N.222.52.B7 TaxID=3229629 RepID=UPI00354AF58A
MNDKLVNLKFLTPIFTQVLSCIFFFFNSESSIIWIFTLIINLLYLERFVKAIPLFVMFLFFLLYTVELRNYFVHGYYISAWFSFQNVYYLNKVMVLHGLFLISFGSMLFNVRDFRNLSINSNPDRVVFYASLVVFVVCTKYGLSGDTVFTNNFGAREVNKSPLFEYSLAILLISIIHTDKSRIQMIVLYACVSYYCLKSTIYGGRVEVIQVVLLFSYFFTNFFIKWSLKKLYISIFLSMAIILIIGKIRHDPTLIINLISDPLSVFLQAPSEEKNIVSTNYGDVLQSSARMIGLSETGYWSFEFRLKSFLSYLFNMFLYGTEAKSYSNLALLDQENYGAGGGGLISAYFYVWLGWLGPVISGLIIGYVLKFASYSRNKKYISVYAFCVLFTFPRWYAYTPIGFTKLCLITTLLYFIVFR